MIPVDLALRLRETGLTWHPAPGDRFFVPHLDMDDEVFTLSDMVVEVHEHPHGRVIGFNGTTEWALDSLEEQRACWLPAEHQLRELLGERFSRLERRDTADGVLHRVLLLDEHGAGVFEAPGASEAYARALLHRLSTAPGATGPAAGSTGGADPGGAGTATSG